MKKITWNGGGAVIRQKLNGRYDWGYCGGGPVFFDVSGRHAVAAIESLLGWDHPAAVEMTSFVQATGR